MPRCVNKRSVPVRDHVYYFALPQWSRRWRGITAIAYWRRNQILQRIWSQGLRSLCVCRAESRAHVGTSTRSTLPYSRSC